MKKKFILLASVSLAFSLGLAACNSTNNNNNTSKDPRLIQACKFLIKRKISKLI